MPTLTEGLTISESLYNLILEGGTDCCRILRHIFGRLDRIKTAQTCSCDECRKALKKITRLLNKDRIGDYFTFREKKGMISYIPKGRVQEINEDGTWKRDGRVEIKPAKWIRSMIHPRLASKIKDNVFAQFDTLLKAEEAKYEVTFEFTEFEDAYNQDNYHQPVFDSCMWGEEVGDFYRHMGARALVARSPLGKLQGRAVVWPKVQVGGETITFMDRVYANKPEFVELFIQHAKAQGWWHKTHQSRDSAKDVTNHEGKQLYKTMRVSVPRSIPDDITYPYLDTFHGGDDYEVVNDDDGAQYTYNQTDGSRCEEDPHEGEVQDVDGNWIDENDSVSVDGETYRTDDDRIVFCDRNQEYILRSDAYCVETGRGRTIYIHEDYVSRA